MTQQSLHIALVQSDLIWENPEKNRQKFGKLFRKIGDKTDVIVLPEMFTTGFTMHPERIDEKQGNATLEWMKEQAKTFNAAITGSILYPEGTTYYNRLFFVLPDQTFYSYDKKHTFTYAGENKRYSSGNERVIITYKNFRIYPLICYDLRFPVWSRYKGDYDVLLYVANWPKPRMEAWDTLLKARAIENMSFTIGLNRVGEDPNGHQYTGHTAVFDPLGDRLAYSESPEIIETTLKLEHLKEIRGNFRFLEDRDSFSLR